MNPHHPYGCRCDACKIPPNPLLFQCMVGLGLFFFFCSVLGSVIDFVARIVEGIYRLIVWLLHIMVLAGIDACVFGSCVLLIVLAIQRTSHRWLAFGAGGFSLLPLSLYFWARYLEIDSTPLPLIGAVTHGAAALGSSCLAVIVALVSVAASFSRSASKQEDVSK